MYQYDVSHEKTEKSVSILLHEPIIIYFQFINQRTQTAIEDFYFIYFNLPFRGQKHLKYEYNVIEQCKIFYYY